MRLASFAIGFALMVAYVPGWSGAATTPRWDVGAVMGLALLLGPAGRMTPAHWCGLALVGWMVLSLAWSGAFLDGVGVATILLVIAIAFAWGATLDDLRPFVAGAAIGLAVSSVIATAQWLGWHGIASADDAPAGLFYSRNRLGAAAAVGIAAAIGMRTKWALDGILPALVLSMDRAAWVAAAVVIVLAIWRRGPTFERFVMLVIFGWVAALAALLMVSLDMPWKMAAISERVALWQFTLSHVTWFGRGLGSFIADGPMLAWPVAPGSALMQVTKAEHPHNEWLWIIYEFGAVSVPLVAAFLVAVWRATDNRTRPVLIAVAILACFAMPFHDPATVAMAAVCAGFAVGAHRRAIAAAHAGRIALCAWVATEPGQGREHGGTGESREPLPVPAAVS